MSRSFKDNTGHEWLIDITFDHALQFEELGINIDGIFEAEGWLTKLAGDRKLFAKLLLIVLADAMAKQNVTEKDFYKRLNQQAVEGAVLAFFNAAVFFSKGETVATAMTESAKKLGTAQTELAAKQIETFTNTALAGLSKSAGDLAEPSASTRARSRSRS